AAAPRLLRTRTRAQGLRQLGGRAPVLARRPERVGGTQPLLCLLVEARVPDRRRRRRRQRLAERDLVGGEAVGRPVPDREDADELVLEEEREAEERREAFALEPVPVLDAGTGEHVAEGERRSMLDDPAGEPLVVVGRGLGGLRGHARRARLRLEAEAAWW